MRVRRLPIRVVLTALLSFMPLTWGAWATRGWAEPRVLGLRHWSAPSCTRVVVDLSEGVAFLPVPSSNAYQVALEFRGTLRGGKEEVLTIKDNLVRQVSLSHGKPRTLRLTVDLKVPGAKHVAFVLPRVEGRPHRLVVDLENPNLGQQMRDERLTVKKETAKGGTKVVVIDPGHGGEDPGALGPRGTREKDVVLAMAKALQHRLIQDPGVQAFLTRNGDYFLALRERVRLAKEYGADLFVSIHADASPNRSTRGASVYCLSLGGATDEAARILAEKENASDLVGGVRLDGDQDLNTILLDLVQTQTINDSLRYGGVVLQALEGVQGIKFSTPRQAGFRVLKAPDIPSVLVEVGFLSNPEEERLLNSPAFQTRLAQALEVAARSILDRQPPVPSSTVAGEGNGKGKPRTHVVKRGETLSDIASLYQTSVRGLAKANDIKDGSRIQAGQHILIP